MVRENQNFPYYDLLAIGRAYMRQSASALVVYAGNRAWLSFDHSAHDPSDSTNRFSLALEAIKTSGELPLSVMKIH